MNELHARRAWAQLTLAYEYGPRFSKPDDYLFQSLIYNKRFEPAGKRLTYGAARKMISQALLIIGEAGADFATHSLRSGGATSAAAAGVSERSLQTGLCAGILPLVKNCFYR